jgi:hypothetical protein
MKVVQEEQNSAVAADNAEAGVDAAGGGVFAAAGDIQMKNCHLDHDRQKMMMMKKMMMKRPHL